MPSTIYIFYIWHLLDGLIHLLYESTYVYNSFTSYISITPSPNPPILHHPTPARFFLGYRDRLYGNAYSDNILAAPWLAYAEADSRYAGLDITTLSLEILTVLLAGPLALYVAASIRRDTKQIGGGEGGRGRVSGHTWFWATVLASGELYGGLMNFLPEWLSGCESLDTGDPVHLWFHIVFLNAIWAFFPLWVLRRAYVDIDDMYKAVERVQAKRTTSIGDPTPQGEGKTKA